MSEPTTPITAPQLRALVILRDQCDLRVGTAQVTQDSTYPRAVAMALWPDSKGWTRRSDRRSTPAGGAMGATMPMKAATLLWRLKDRGYACLPNARRNDWSITAKGRAALAERNL